MDDLILEVQGLAKSYPGFALRDVSFSLPRGQVIGFIGPNGAGKTTVIRCIVGIAPPEAGSIRIFGKDLESEGKAIRDRIGFVSEDAFMYGLLCARDMGRIAEGLFLRWNGARYATLLEEFKIDPRKASEKLSKGQRMKLSIAIALAHEPDLLVMDEPTSGLDPVFRSEILDMLYAHIQNERGAVLFSTHITADIEKIADRVLFIQDGAIVIDEVKDDVLERYRLVKGESARSPEVEGIALGIRKTEASFTALVENSALGSLGNGSFRSERATLEDILVYSSREDYRA